MPHDAMHFGSKSHWIEEAKHERREKKGGGLRFSPVYITQAVITMRQQSTLSSQIAVARAGPREIKQPFHSPINPYTCRTLSPLPVSIDIALFKQDTPNQHCFIRAITPSISCHARQLIVTAFPS